MTQQDLYEDEEDGESTSSPFTVAMTSDRTILLSDEWDWDAEESYLYLNRWQDRRFH